MQNIISFYEYIYFRLFLFQKKLWDDSKSMGGISSNYVIAFSSMALVFSIDILISKTFNINRLFDSLQIIVVLIIALSILLHFLVKIDEDVLEERFSNTNKNSFSWRLKGFLSLVYVFGPMILYFLLMW
ncbi:MAG: hypothetical protein CMC96_13630 [Flavobacteriales bacterium]|nr:hypothetical protein [Flavobacteriales bacterium]|tara:strand:- start:27430 stop:27816 length:387 start_codon:yes stop_codon:yes gene_type:complete